MMKNNTVGIMMGLCGDEFWKIGGDVKFAFWSKMQVDMQECIYSRELKNHEYLLSKWENSVRQRVLHNMETGISTYNDVILKNIYSKKPAPFSREQFINRYGKIIEVSDVFSVKTYSNLDTLKRDLVEIYPDIEFRGIVVSSLYSQIIREKKRIKCKSCRLTDDSGNKSKVALMKDLCLQKIKERVGRKRENDKCESSHVWFSVDLAEEERNNDRMQMLLREKHQARFRDNIILQRVGGILKDRF